MNAEIASILTLPPLLLILVTALYGMNDVRTHSIRHLASPKGLIESALGFSFLATFAGSGLLIFGVLAGLQAGVYLFTWRMLVFLIGIAGIFFFAAAFMPWKQWVRSLPDRIAAAEARKAASAAKPL